MGRRGLMRSGAGMVALGCALACALFALRLWQEHAAQPIAYIDIEGPLGAAERRIVEQRLALVDRADPDIARASRDLQRLEWVERAAVRRVWPDGLRVTIVKHSAVARWGSSAYLSERGEVFSSPELGPERLPRLLGPAGSERLVMEQYQQLTRAFQQSGQTITHVRLAERGDWMLRLQSDVTIRLGKEDISDRLIRLLRICEAAGLLERIDAIAEIDARYTNGVAVKWKRESCAGDCLELAGNDNLKRVHTL